MTGDEGKALILKTKCGGSIPMKNNIFFLFFELKKKETSYSYRTKLVYFRNDEIAIDPASADLFPATRKIIKTKSYLEE